MNNPNSPTNKIKKLLKERWSASDLPGGSKRFQIALFFKDLCVFVGLPLFSIFIVKSCDNVSSEDLKGKIKKAKTVQYESDSTIRSQIIDFSGKKHKPGKYAGISKRAPGTLIRVKLQNSLETYSSAPVHAVVLDNSLGSNLRGSILIGDATPDPGFERINITFSLLRKSNSFSVAIPLAARALSLNGTFGVVGKKKEGYFARAALGSAQNAMNNGQGRVKDDGSFRDLLLNALATGLMQESQSSLTTEQNRSNVLTVNPNLVFYAELTDYFPGNN